MTSRDVRRLVAQAKRSVKMKPESQQDLLRRVQKRLKLDRAALAGVLEVSTVTLKAYFAAEGATKHRRLTDEKRRLLLALLDAAEK